MQLKKIIQKKTNGQALLIVLVISTLTFMILMQVATNISSSQANIRRTSNFNAAEVLDENALNEIIKQVDSNNCNLTSLNLVINTYKPIPSSNCNISSAIPSGISPNAVSVLGRLGNTSLVPITVNSPVALYVNTLTTGVKIACQNPVQTDKFIVTRVFIENDGSYKVDKGISDCKNILPSPGTGYGNIELYSPYIVNGKNSIAINPTNQTINYTRNTVLVAIRMLDGSSNTNAVSIQIEYKPNSGSLPTTIPINKPCVNTCVVSTTGTYEFIVASDSGLNSSSSLIKFSKQIGNNNYAPLGFDFAYFGEDRGAPFTPQ